jgi:hypothetical protein
VLNHATGFSWGSILAVVGLMAPVLMIERSFRPVVKRPQGRDQRLRQSERSQLMAIFALTEYARDSAWL